MGISHHALLSSSSRMFALAAAVALCVGPKARAGSITLDIAAAANANIAFVGSGAGSGASFNFTNNSSGDGFQITETSGDHSAVGLFGTIGGTFSYTSVTTTAGGLETALVTTSNGTLSISDGTDVLTGNISGMNIFTFGTTGAINYTGSINLSGISYTGSNTELLALENDVNMNNAGGVVTLSFQFTNPSQTLLSLETGNNSTSYSGTVSASGEFSGQSVPEPGTLCLGCIALGTIVLGTSWRRARRR
jgi:hypothetical protein